MPYVSKYAFLAQFCSGGKWFGSFLPLCGIVCNIRPRQSSSLNHRWLDCIQTFSTSPPKRARSGELGARSNNIINPLVPSAYDVGLRVLFSSGRGIFELLLSELRDFSLSCSDIRVEGGSSFFLFSLLFREISMCQQTERDKTENASKSLVTLLFCQHLLMILGKW